MATIETMSGQNHDKAWAYFVEQGLIPKDAPKYSYALHHVDETLRHTNYLRYIQWNIEDLEVVPYGEHSRHHATGAIFTEERRKHISEANKGQIPWNKGKTNVYSDETLKRMKENHADMSGSNNPMYGKKQSDETKAKISKANSHPNPKLSEYRKTHNPMDNEEARNKISKSMSKLKWFNNGTKCVRLEVCPEGFVPGRLKKETA